MEKNNDTLAYINTLIDECDINIKEEDGRKINLIQYQREPRYFTQDMLISLSQLQGAYPVIGVNKSNPYHKSKYSDLDNILSSIRPILEKYGFSIEFETSLNANNDEIMTTRLAHISGGWNTSQTLINPPKNDPQSYGAYVSYKKRYQLMLLLGITICNDPSDDDGESIMKDQRIREHKGNARFAPINTSPHTIDDKQLAQLEHELDGHPELVRQILNKMNIDSLSKMPEAKFLKAIDRIREIKMTKPQHNN